MGLSKLAANVPPPGPERIILTGSGEPLEFRRPEPADLIMAYSDEALDKLNNAAETLLKQEPGLMIKPSLLTHEGGAFIVLLATCYQFSEDEIKANKGKAPSATALFLSVAARNSYMWDRILTEFERTFPQFAEWTLYKLGMAAPGNSQGGGKLGSEAPPPTPGEVSPHATETSPESPSTTESTPPNAPSGDGSG